MRSAELMAKVKMNASTDLDRHYPKYWSGRVAVRLLGGQTLFRRSDYPEGPKRDPMTQSEVEAKFLSLAGRSWEMRKRDR